MSYEGREIAEQDGAPVELYLFTRNQVDLTLSCVPSIESTELHRFTSCEQNIETEPLSSSSSSSDVWLSASIARSQLEVSDNKVRNNLQLTVPRDFPIAELFRTAPPDNVIGLTVYRFHRQDEERVVLWTGRVLNCQWSGAAAVLNCEPVSTSLRRTGLRRLYQRQCPHALYGPMCKVSRTEFSHETDVVTVDGATLVLSSVMTASSSLSDPDYAGGMVEWETPNGDIERRFVQTYDADTLTFVLQRPFSGVEPGMTVTILPGCDHTTETCKTVFDNLGNYGGFPYIPAKNPFDGTPVY